MSVRREGRPLSDTPKSYRHIVRILGRSAEKWCGALWTEGLDAPVAAIGNRRVALGFTTQHERPNRGRYDDAKGGARQDLAIRAVTNDDP